MDDRIERAKRQIRRMVVEVEAMSYRQIGAGEFYNVFLGRVVACLAARGSAVGVRSAAGILETNCALRWQRAASWSTRGPCGALRGFLETNCALRCT
ncbi:MAG TPA: hypothetical protein VHC22_23230 [Pirellulales bacterium]|nr:hypothetical protein [Pirellulales bacterium]